MGGLIQRVVREITGCEDPYREAKDASNSIALQLYPQLKRMVEESIDPLETAIRLSAAGNVIDFAVHSEVDLDSIESSIESCLSAPMAVNVVADFRAAAERAREILYLGDNAGEIVFDRLVVEELPMERISFVVKGRPVINDVTLLDAQATGMAEIVAVIDNGSDIPGTVLEDCSDSFRRRFEAADMIISKGQGNYESLSDASRDIFFIFKAKCPVITMDVGCEIGSVVLLHKERGTAI
jgi:uncharacterized protein with ATP-grasp and redox domains